MLIPYSNGTTGVGNGQPATIGALTSGQPQVYDIGDTSQQGQHDDDAQPEYAEQLGTLTCDRIAWKEKYTPEP